MASKLLLAGKKCLITGGSQGIGLAIAHRFAAEGASVTLVARNKTKLEQAVKTLPQVFSSTTDSENGDQPYQRHSIAQFDVSKLEQFTESDIGQVSITIFFLLIYFYIF